MTRRILTLLAVVLAATVGCNADPQPEKPGFVPPGTTESAPIAWIKNGNAPPVTDEYIEYAAKFRLVMHAPGVWANRRAAMDSIHAINPDTHLGEYMTVNTFGPWILEEAGNDNHYGRLVAAIDGRWAVTTTGDTASIWKNFPMFDFMDPDVRKAYIAEKVRYTIENNIQWYMWDYFQNRYAHYDMGYPGVDGELDLDRDGIAHQDDIDEQEKMHVVFQEYFTEMREAMPDHVLLIPNGNWAMTQDSFAILADGVYVEQFPNWFFTNLDTSIPNTPATDLANALDPAHPKGLHMLTTERYRNGRGLVLLGDIMPYEPWTELAETFPGCVAAFNQEGQPGLPPIGDTP